MTKAIKTIELEAAQEFQAPAVHEPQTIMAVISKAASDPATDVDKLERLMAMYERLEARNSETAFNAAMTQAQSEIGRITADGNNRQTSSKYATYAALDRALRPIYTRHGFSLSFDTGDGAPDLHVRVLCYVAHQSGHSRTYHVDMPADGKGAKGGDVMTKTHATGSAISYGMRYLLKGIFNVAVGEDDDGNAASIPRITEQQAADLRALIEEVGANEANFLKYMKAGSIEQIQAAAYRDAVSALERKRNK